MAALVFTTLTTTWGGCRMFNMPKSVVAGTNRIDYLYSYDGQKRSSSSGGSSTYYRGVGGAVAKMAGSLGGFAGGAVTGAAGGFAGGFAGGATSAWLNGAGFGQGMKAGATGALKGGAIGGIFGGISAAVKGYNFWNGTKVLDYSVDFGSGGYDPSLSSSQRDSYLRQRIYDNYEVGVGDHGITKITTETPSDLKLRDDGMYLRGDSPVAGTCRSNAAGYSDIYISPNATYQTVTHFQATAGHELIHAYHNYITSSQSPASRPHKNYSERVAHEYSYGIYNNAGNSIMAGRVLQQINALDAFKNVPANFRDINIRSIGYVPQITK